MSFIKASLIGNIKRRLQIIKTELAFDNFIYFEEAIECRDKRIGKKINRINLWYPFMEGDLSYMDWQDVNAVDIIEIYKRLKSNKFYIYKKIEGREYKIRRKNVK